MFQIVTEFIQVFSSKAAYFLSSLPQRKELEQTAGFLPGDVQICIFQLLVCIKFDCWLVIMV